MRVCTYALIIMQDIIIIILSRAMYIKFDNVAKPINYLTDVLLRTTRTSHVCGYMICGHLTNVSPVSPSIQLLIKFAAFCCTFWSWSLTCNCCCMVFTPWFGVFFRLKVFIIMHLPFKFLLDWHIHMHAPVIVLYCKEMRLQITMQPAQARLEVRSWEEPTSAST